MPEDRLEKMIKDNLERQRQSSGCFVASVCDHISRGKESSCQGLADLANGRSVGNRLILF